MPQPATYRITESETSGRGAVVLTLRQTEFQAGAGEFLVRDGNEAIA